MSRAQGDSYKTHTNHDLNAYRARLDAKIYELEQREEKWFRVGDGWIFTTKKNKLSNPNGGWKWNGWEVRCQEYSIRVFAGDCVKEINGKIFADGWSEKSWFFEGHEEARQAANDAWKEAKEIARNAKVSSREENKDRGHEQ